MKKTGKYSSYEKKISTEKKTHPQTKNLLTNIGTCIKNYIRNHP